MQVSLCSPMKISVEASSVHYITVCRGLVNLTQSHRAIPKPEAWEEGLCEFGLESVYEAQLS